MVEKSLRERQERETGVKVLAVDGHGSRSRADFGFSGLPQMVFDGESVDGDGKLLGVNVREFLLPAAILVKFVQHFVGDHFGPIAAEFFHSL